MDQTDHINIPDPVMQRWLAIGRLLQPVSVALLLELNDLRNDPRLRRIGRAAKAARFIECATTGEMQAEAAAIAAELERLLS